jgi:hypothetical protein
MSFYDKGVRSVFLTSVNRKGNIIQALVAAELKNHANDPEACFNALKASLDSGKKRSSASLLRKKLQDALMNKSQKI